MQGPEKERNQETKRQKQRWMDEAERERNTMLLRRETSRAWLECWGAWDIGARDEAVGRRKP